MAGTWTVNEVFGGGALHTKDIRVGGIIRLDKTVLGGGYDEIHIEQLLDTVSFGECDFLRVRGHYDMQMNSGAGIPQIVVAWFINGGVSLFEDDLTGWSGTPGHKSGSLAFDLPNHPPGWIWQNSITIWISGTCTGHSWIAIDEWRLYGT